MLKRVIIAHLAEKNSSKKTAKQKPIQTGTMSNYQRTTTAGAILIAACVLTIYVRSPWEEQNSDDILRAAKIPLAKFQGVLTSELDLQSSEEALSAYTAETDSAWKQYSNQEQAKEVGERATRTPFLICHSDANLSGYERKQIVYKSCHAAPTDSPPADDGTIQSKLSIILNTAEHTCFMTEIDATKGCHFMDEQDNDYISAQPLTSHMKIRAGTTDILLDPKYMERLRQGLHVSLCPGIINDDVEVERGDFLQQVEKKGGELMERIIQFGRTLLLLDVHAAETKSSSGTNRADRTRESSLFRHSSMFYWTSSHHRRELTELKMVDGGRSSGAANFERALMWRKALEDGIGAEHGCAHVFRAMVIEPSGSRSFQIDLSSSSLLRRSAGNNSINKSDVPACLMSLVAAFAVQPEVCSVEADTPISPLTSVAQWIVQSNVPDHRPFWDAGYSGSGQVVQVSDSG